MARAWLRRGGEIPLFTMAKSNLPIATALFLKEYNKFIDYDWNDENRSKLAMEWNQKVSVRSENKTDRKARLAVWTEVMQPVLLSPALTSFKLLSDWEAGAVAGVMANPEAMKEIRNRFYVLAAEYEAKENGIRSDGEMAGGELEEQS